MDIVPAPGTKSFRGRPGVVLNLDEVSIATDRLVLRPITHQFAEIIFQEFTPEINRFMFPASPKEIGETTAFISSAIALRQKNAELVTVILGRETNEFLGVCGLHSRKDPEEPEFGIWLKKGAHGSGYGREAIHALYDWACNSLEVAAFIYPVDKANTPSRKIPESLQGVIVGEVMAPTMGGGVLDKVIYRIPARKE